MRLYKNLQAKFWLAISNKRNLTRPAVGSGRGARSASRKVVGNRAYFSKDFGKSSSVSSCIESLTLHGMWSQCECLESLPEWRLFLRIFFFFRTDVGWQLTFHKYRDFSFVSMFWLRSWKFYGFFSHLFPTTATSMNLPIEVHLRETNLNYIKLWLHLEMKAPTF